jgi:nucleotide-binding universal stress UspA family protein
MKILLAVDESDCSEAAVQALAARPWPPDTVVRVLSVAPRPMMPPPPGPAWEVTMVVPPVEHMRTRAAEIVQRATTTLRAHGLATETLVRTGDAGAEIVRAAEEWHAELIFVGSRGLTGVKRWLLGSVAQFVAAHAHCSVEVVHRPEAEVPPTRKAG